MAPFDGLIWPHLTPCLSKTSGLGTVPVMRLSLGASEEVGDLRPGVLLIECTGYGPAQQGLCLGGKAHEEVDRDPGVTKPLHAPGRAEGRHGGSKNRLGLLIDHWGTQRHGDGPARVRVEARPHPCVGCWL